MVETRACSVGREPMHVIVVDRARKNVLAVDCTRKLSEERYKQVDTA